MDIQQEDAEASRIIRWAQTKITNKIQYANSYFCCRLLNILEKTQQRNPTDQEFIDQMLAYIHRHIEDNIQVNDLANHFHFSEKHIHHLFKNAFNDTPKKFINSTKLTYIQYLLTSTNLSLQELTDKYKYSSVSHLIKCFKQKYGVTPTEYRNNHYQ
jgi:AraC-like DNA-binding protein